MPAAINWTEDITTTLFDRIIVGDPICAILADLGISQASFYRHRLDDEAFESTIARAQEMAQEAEVDRMLQLADSAVEENVNAIKLRIWARMWIAGKRKPKKYGEREEITGADGRHGVRGEEHP